MSLGTLQIVLHAHLPFVRHPENPYHLEENWLFEAISETYLPLLEALENLDRDGVPGALTVSVSQPLAAMFDDELLRDRMSDRLRSLLALCEAERLFPHDDPGTLALTEWYHARFSRQLAHWEGALDRDLLGAFMRHHASGRIELATCVGTHGSLPLMRFESSRRAQILAAAEQFEARCGFAPAGMWMGECAYWWGVEALLAEAGVRWSIVDSHGIENAENAPTRGVYAPLISSHGVAFFGRDAESSRQVWSASEGYPGDPNYREFYRDVGFDRPAEYIASWIHPDGIRVDTGLKYFAITGRTPDKRLWNPDVAESRARDHARHFVECRVAQMSHLAGCIDTAPVVTSPYDAELFGHWWFEGPRFLEHVLRETAAAGRFEAATPSTTLARDVPWQVANPSPSSWGENGYWSVWLNEANAWMCRALHGAEGEMRRIADRYGDDEAALPAVEQAARELLLAQSSDWAFIVTTGTATGYAEQRTREHVANVFAIGAVLDAGDARATEALRAKLAERTPIFPDLCAAWWQSDPAAEAG